MPGHAGGMAPALHQLKLNRNLTHPMTATLQAQPEISWSVPLLSETGTEARTIGFSKEQRAICCHSRGAPDAPLKVLVLAGQHGDEGPAQLMLESLLSMDGAALIRRLPNLQLAVIPEANPDGCAARSRCNADGIDLNRDHQSLRSDEIAAIHQFVRQWKPHVILDLHSYPSRRRHLLEQNVVLDHDVFIDVPSHPAIMARSDSVTGADVLQGLLRALWSQEVRAERYTIVETSGRVRHSTPDVLDARNGLALRYGVFTLLVECRQPRRDEAPDERERLQAAQERSLLAIVEWLNCNHSLFSSRSTVEAPTPGAPVQVRFKYRQHHAGLQLTCRNLERGEPVSVTFHNYCASLETRHTVLLPEAYAVPLELDCLRDVLRRQAFQSIQQAYRMHRVEKLRIDATRPPRRPGSSIRLTISLHPGSQELGGYEVFSTRQRGGEALAIFLEPESQHGLHRIPEMNLPLAAQSWYPVLRVMPQTWNTPF